jgi:hypothetical protein
MASFPLGTIKLLPRIQKWAGNRHPQQQLLGQQSKPPFHLTKIHSGGGTSDIQWPWRPGPRGTLARGLRGATDGLVALLHVLRSLILEADGER